MSIQPISHAAQAAHPARRAVPSGANSTLCAGCATAKPQTPSTRNPLSAPRTRELFAILSVRYPHVWASQYVGDGGNTDDDALALALAEWSAALAGIGDAQLRTGLRADYLRADHWPPGPAEFAAMCHGIPTLARVKHILRRAGPARTRFTRLVWSLLDTFQFTRADGKYADRLLADAYELAKAHVMSGHPLPDEPSGALEHRPAPRTPASEETARAAMQEIASILADRDQAMDTEKSA